MQPVEIEVSPELRERIKTALHTALLSHTGGTEIPVTDDSTQKIHAYPVSEQVLIRDEQLEKALVNAVEAALYPHSGNKGRQRHYCKRIASAPLKEEALQLTSALVEMQNGLDAPVCVFRGVCDDPLLLSVFTQALARLSSSELKREKGPEYGDSSVNSTISGNGKSIESHAHQSLHLDESNPFGYDEVHGRIGATRFLACAHQSANPLSTQFLPIENYLEQLCEQMQCYMRADETQRFKPFLLEALHTDIWHKGGGPLLHENTHPLRTENAPRYSLSSNSISLSNGSDEMLGTIAKKHGFSLERAKELILHLESARDEVRTQPKDVADVYMRQGDLLCWNDFAVLHSAGRFAKAHGVTDADKRVLHSANAPALRQEGHTPVNHFPHVLIEQPEEHWAARIAEKEALDTGRCGR